MPKTVLLADDSVAIQRVVNLSFANEDVRVVAADDADQAIAAIRESPPDIALVDIEMPGRSGYQVIEYIRSQPHLSAVPVLLLPGAFQAIDSAQARRLGADGVLSKPFDPVVLVSRVKELLAGGRSESEARVAPSEPPVEGAGLELFPPASQPVEAEPDLPLATPPATSSGADRYFQEIDEAFAALSRMPRPPLSSLDEEFPVVDEPVRALRLHDPPAGAVPLTDAFAALLDAERTERMGGPMRTGTGLPAERAAVDVSALADEVARRVLEQLTDRVVRETVTGIVASTAERLVREEIERIKSNIK